MAQALVSFTTVTLPVTAVAPAGTPPRPVTWKVAGVPAVSLALNPLPDRLSRRRTGVSGWYVAPFASGVKKPVTSNTRSVVLPAPATKVALSLPPTPRPIVRLLALVSPDLKLIELVVGAVSPTGPT